MRIPLKPPPFPSFFFIYPFFPSSFLPSPLLDVQAPWHQSPQAQAAPFDLVLDLIGGPYEGPSMRLLAKGGRLAVFGASGPGVERVSLAGASRVCGFGV